MGQGLYSPGSGLTAPATPPVTNINTNSPSPVTSTTSTDPSIQTGVATPPADPGGLQTATPQNIGVDLTAPGAGENVGNAMLSYYAQNGTPTTSQDAAQAYQSFQASTPADMSSYYDNAQRLQDNAINTQMAARGSYGSSNAVGTLAAADTNLRAQQAQAEAQYGLQRAQLGGSLASGADTSSQAASGNELNWMSGLSNLGFNVQKENAARGQTLLGDQEDAASIASGIQGQVGTEAIQNDQSLLAAMLAAGSGATADQVTAAQNKLSQDMASNNQTTSAATAGTTALAQYV